MKGIFSNVTAVRIDGNQGLCGGPLELHLLACHVTPINSSKQRRHSIVQKVVIPLSSILLVAIVITVMLVWREKPIIFALIW